METDAHDSSWSCWLQQLLLTSHNFYEEKLDIWQIDPIYPLTYPVTTSLTHRSVYYRLPSSCCLSFVTVIIPRLVDWRVCNNLPCCGIVVVSYPILLLLVCCLPKWRTMSCAIVIVPMLSLLYPCYCYCTRLLLLYPCNGYWRLIFYLVVVVFITTLFFIK